MKRNRSNAVIHFFTTDIPRKILALLLACLLYWTISMKGGTKQEVSGVPINVELPSGKLLIGVPPKVSLEVSYNKTLRSMVSSSEILGTVTITENSCAPGTNNVSVRLDKKNFKAPLGVSVSKIVPQELILTVEDRIVRDVPVVFRHSGDLPADYLIKKVTFVPDKVQVSGPKSLVMQLSGVSTKEIPMTGSTYTFDFRAALQEEPGLRVTPNFVTATIEVVKNRAERSFPNVPIALLNASGKFQAEFLTSPSIEVKIAGPKRILDSLVKDQIHGFCDVSSLTQPGVYMVDTGCFINHGNGLEIISIYPEKVQIKLSR